MRLHSNLRLWVHEIYYEHLLGPWSRATFELSSSFLRLANNTGNITSPKSISHRVHNMTCAMRLANINLRTGCQDHLHNIDAPREDGRVQGRHPGAVTNPEIAYTLRGMHGEHLRALHHVARCGGEQEALRLHGLIWMLALPACGPHLFLHSLLYYLGTHLVWGERLA